MENQEFELTDSRETIALELFISRVRTLARVDDFNAYQSRLKLIHTKRRDLFLKLLALGYNLKQSSVLLARLEVAALDINAENIAEWTPDRILELIYRLNLKF